MQISYSKAKNVLTPVPTQDEIEQYSEFLKEKESFEAWKVAKQQQANSSQLLLPTLPQPIPHAEPVPVAASSPPIKPPSTRKTSTVSQNNQPSSNSSSGSNSPDVADRKGMVLEAIATIEAMKKDVTVSMIRLYFSSNYPGSSVGKSVGSLCTSLVKEELLCIVPTEANRARRFRITEIGRKFLSRILYLKKLPSA